MKVHVLMVEDDDADAILTKRAFRKEPSIQLWRARTGEEAIESLGRQVPDIVLLDIALPGMTGQETLKAIRSHPDTRIAAIPVVALTSSRSDLDVISMWDARVTGYLTKPVQPDEFRDLASVFVRWWDANERPPRQ